MDLPALGKPTRATSATSFSSMSSQRSSPFSPCSAKAGARRLLERKRAFPRPPRPPSAASQRSPAPVRSHKSEPSRSRTTVPTGTGTSRSGPRPPWRRLPEPCPPSVARRWGWSRNPSNEAWLGVATSQTSPPRPPSPPSGPPLSTWASRRKETAPAPPSPALAWSCASSTKPDMQRSYGAAASPLATGSDWAAGHPGSPPGNLDQTPGPVGGLLSGGAVVDGGADPLGDHAAPADPDVGHLA